MAMEFRIGKRKPDRFGIVNGDQIHKQADLSKDMRKGDYAIWLTLCFRTKGAVIPGPVIAWQMKIRSEVYDQDIIEIASGEADRSRTGLKGKILYDEASGGDQLARISKYHGIILWLLKYSEEDSSF